MAAPVPMTPKEIVHELNKYIIGQDDAKRAVAIALRNCWRRLQVAEDMRDEITSKNILMIGPTGVGKTEIARRLAKLANAPFIKVEATKFTEVGYVGRDVESIIRDLVDIAFKQLREQEITKKMSLAEENAEERVLDVLLPKPRSKMANEPNDDEQTDSKTRQKFRTKLHNGELNDKEIEIDVSAASIGVEIMGPPGMEEMTSQLQSLFQNLNTDKTKTRKLKIKDAVRLLKEEEAAKLVNEEDLKSLAVQMVEQTGIVFIDEFDKITRRESASGGDVSREGVQRDLLPLVEGSTVTTKYGMVKTDHILFIASGAFHISKPSDLIPEMQGRFPIRVELKALSAADFKRILTEPDVSLITQHKALLATENVSLEFKEDAIQRLAELAWQVNESNENIGARRLHTILERLLEKISFEAPDHSGEQFVIDTAYVNNTLEALAKNQDLSNYIL